MSGPYKFYPPIPVRYIKYIDSDTYLGIEWGFPGEPCPVTGGKHSHRKLVGPKPDDLVWTFADERWPDTCEHCGLKVDQSRVVLNDFNSPYKLSRWTSSKKRFDTQTGEPMPGDAWWRSMLGYMTVNPNKCWCRWSNCDGNHLYVCLPDGREWDLMGRASNCDRKDDTLHRCWVVHGDPAKGEVLHVDKVGNTCGAGSGSFLSNDWHGFIHNGIMRSC